MLPGDLWYLIFLSPLDSCFIIFFDNFRKFMCLLFWLNICFRFKLISPLKKKTKTSSLIMESEQLWFLIVWFSYSDLNKILNSFGDYDWNETSYQCLSSDIFIYKCMWYGFVSSIVVFKWNKIPYYFFKGINLVKQGQQMGKQH